eukprot:jgi/Mesvir1/24746/Mv22008-RA.1
MARTALASLSVFIVAVALAGGAFAADTLPKCAAKGDAGCVLDLLQQPPYDPNVKDENGRTALFFAASTGNVDLVKILLQFEADPRIPANGKKTPLLAATQGRHTEVVRVLLAYGASPDAADDSGVTPRSVAAVGGMAAIDTLFEMEAEGGAAAFEEPPGTWRMFESDKHNKNRFFHNVETGETRWTRPPVCAWQLKLMPNGQKAYQNQVTHQTMWTIPRALAWKKVQGKDGNWFWWNYKTEKSQADAPAELPDDVRNDPAFTQGMHWNTVTGETQWIDPKERNWNVMYDSQGRKFWFKPATGDSTWEQPKEAAWVETHSNEHNRKFYYNEVTMEKQWEKPEPLAWEKVDELKH